MKQLNANPSGLETIIPPEIKNDEFYNLIIELASSQKLLNVLEIGSSAGGGSTEAFVIGLSKNPSAPKLFCMEVSQPRFEELKQRYAKCPFVRCYNTSSVSLDKFATFAEVESFYLSTQTNLNCYPLHLIFNWLQQDLDYVENSGLNENGITRIRQENGIDQFDMVLIDGSEFTGKSELAEVYGARWLLLDDINIFKNNENYFQLKNDLTYQIYCENWHIRNGYAVFKRIDTERQIHFSQNEFTDIKDNTNTAPPAFQDVALLSKLINNQPSKFKIIVDGVFFQLMSTGIARLWKALLAEWSNTDFAPSVLLLDRAGSAPKITGICTRVIPAYDYNATDKDRAMLQTICNEEGADLFVSTYYTTPLTTPSVFYAYDMIPENTPFFDLNNPPWREKHYGLTHAAAYIAISRYTAMDLAKACPLSAKNVSIAYPAVDRTVFTPASAEDLEQFRRRYDIIKPYLLFVGHRQSYKNAKLLFEGFARLTNINDLVIVCVGGAPDLEQDLRQIVPGVTVHVLHLADNELRMAYSGAVAFVYPSIYEGFGLPILEAMACDCPVITCQNSSIPEAAGAAALFVASDSPDEMAASIQHIQEPEIRDHLIKMGRRQVQKFSWSKMADEVREALLKTYKSIRLLAAGRT